MKVENMMDRLKDIDKYGKQSKGRKELTAHLEGERLTPRQMILAKCYDCMGYYVDGRVDCNIPYCSLYPMMPHRKGEKYRTRALSDDHKKALTKGRRSGSQNTPTSVRKAHNKIAGEKNSPEGIPTPTPGKEDIFTTDRRDSQDKLPGKPDPDPTPREEPRKRIQNPGEREQISLFPLKGIHNPYPGRKRKTSGRKQSSSIQK